MIGVSTIETENRMKEIAGNLKRDMKDLLGESANIVSGFFKRGACTVRGMADRWKNFTQDISGAVGTLFQPFENALPPAPPPEREPMVTVMESGAPELPVGTRAPEGLGELLHEWFGPQLQNDLEKLSSKVLGFFRQHCTISRMEEQFEAQAEAMPQNGRKQFERSMSETITALRLAANTGRQTPAPQREQARPIQPEEPPPTYRAKRPQQEEGQAPRRSVKVTLKKIKEGQAANNTPRKGRASPQR